MERILLFTSIIVSFLIGFVFRTFLTKLSNEISQMEIPKRQIDEELIRKTEATYDIAWQQGDIEGVVGMFGLLPKFVPMQLFECTQNHLVSVYAVG